MITLMKNYSDESKTQKRINVKKMISLKELINKPIKNITFKFNNLKELEKIKDFPIIDNGTEVKVLLDKNDKKYTFYLKFRRNINNQTLNSLNLMENVLID